MALWLSNLIEQSLRLGGVVIYGKFNEEDGFLWKMDKADDGVC